MPLQATRLTVSDYLINVSMSDEMIRENIGNFIIAESQSFTVVESPFVLKIVKFCLACKRLDVFIPREDATRN